MPRSTRWPTNSIDGSRSTKRSCPTTTWQKRCARLDPPKQCEWRTADGEKPTAGPPQDVTYRAVIASLSLHATTSASFGYDAPLDLHHPPSAIRQSPFP